MGQYNIHLENLQGKRKHPEIGGYLSVWRTATLSDRVDDPATTAPTAPVSPPELIYLNLIGQRHLILRLIV